MTSKFSKWDGYDGHMYSEWDYVFRTDTCIQMYSEHVFSMSITCMSMYSEQYVFRTVDW